MRRSNAVFLALAVCFLPLAAPAQVSVTLSPGSATVPVNQTQDFAAVVTGSNKKTVKFKVCDGNGKNCVKGGNTTIGTITEIARDADNNPIARYTAPAVVPSPPACTSGSEGCVVKIKAIWKKRTASGVRKAKATASVTINHPAPVLSSISPSETTVGSPGFTLAVNGSGFASFSVVRWNGSNRTTTFVSTAELQAAISASDVAAAGTAQVTVFNPSPGGGTSNAIIFTIAGVAIPTSALPDAVAGRGYNFLLTATGGTLPYTWSATGLPAGMTLNSATGELRGTPTAAGTSTVTIQVTDSSSPPFSATRQYSLVVAPPLAIVNTKLLNGLKGSSYQQTLAATGGLGGYTWSVVNPGVDPPGLEITTNGPGNGTYEGTPTTPGSFTFTIRVVDTGSTAASPVATQKSFTVVVREPFAYVTNTDSNSVSVIDTTTNTVVRTVAVGTSPQGVALTPDGRFAYVSNFGNGAGSPEAVPSDVSVIDTTTNAVVATIPVRLWGPRGVAVTPDGARVYVGNSISAVGDIYVIDTASNTAATLNLGLSNFFGLAITPDGKRIYITNQFQGSVDVIDTSSNSLVARLRGVGGGGGVAISPDGRFAYVPGGSGVAAIDTSSLSVAGSVGGVAGAFGVAVTPDARFVYTTGAGVVSVIDAASDPGSMTVVGTVPVGGDPRGIASTPDGRFAYVANSSGTVSVIDRSTNSVVATIGVGNNPCCETGVAIMPDPLLRLHTTALALGRSGFPYRFSIVATGGVAPYKFTAGPSNLPPGLALDGSTGLVSGTPTTFGSFSFEVTVTDSAVPAESISKTITLEILAPRAYVTNFNGDSVSVIDTGTNTVIATIPVGVSPAGIALTLDGTQAYVANLNSPSGPSSGANNVSVIDTVRNTVSELSLRCGPVAIRNPRGVAVTPDGTQVYVTGHSLDIGSGSSSSALWVIHTDDFNGCVAPIGVGGTDPAGIAISPDGIRAYVANTGSDNVSVIATATGGVFTPIPVGDEPVGVAFTPDGSRAYVTNRKSNSVSVISTSLTTVVATVGVGANPLGVVVTPDGARVYVANGLSDTVSVISTASNSVIATISVGSLPSGISISADGRRAYVINSGANSVSVIDIEPGSSTFHTVVATVPVGSGPCCEQGIAVQFGR